VADFDQYRGVRALVTGHTGFKGGWLSLWLARLGAEVTGISQPPSTTPSLFETAGVGQHVHSVFADLRDLNSVAGVWRQAQPDIVFHLAAQPLVRRSYRDPLTTIESNVLGTTHVLETARAERRRLAIVVVTSDKCYENDERARGYCETDRLGGRDVYSASKAMAELVVASYRASFFPAERIDQHGVAVATARAGNVIGGGDWAADRLIPDAVRALARGESVAVRHPSATRPWQHVLDPLAGYLMLGTALLASDSTRALATGAWNFGPEPAATRTVRELIECFLARYGAGTWHEHADGSPPEAHALSLCSDKARRHLGWTPRWSFLETVAATADWYRAWRAGDNMRHWCERQIDAWTGQAVAHSI